MSVQQDTQILVTSLKALPMGTCNFWLSLNEAQTKPDVEDGGLRPWTHPHCKGDTYGTNAIILRRFWFGSQGLGVIM